MTLLTVLVVALSAAPKAAPKPALDALDFDNGALLLSETGSYGTETDSWSAWRLTDGDASLGWCSPEGKPLGGTFVWDLDGVWQLDAFVLSTENTEEASYPGVSAKSVELYLAEKPGDFKKVGAFTVGTQQKKSFPLKGARAKQVKLVVTGNHGNAEYTEIAEIDLLGTRTGAVAVASIAGDYTTTYGPMRFAQDKDEVFGCYDWTAVAAVWGSMSGRVARVTWYEDDEASKREGTATFAVREDGRLWGVWYENGTLMGLWEGPRGDPPTCQPKRKGQLSMLLKSKGRAVLYGIHFDVNADVPLPESKGSIDELVQALKDDAKVRVLVEGHTDATNTDAYNLDLSQRRAKSVVDWLTKAGVEGGRLEAKGFGRTKPVADNATAQGRALNRRVEVSVLK